MQKRLNPYVVLGLGLEADARAANLAFIQRLAKFKSFQNPPYSTAELEWALQEIEAAAAKGELIETFEVPALPEAYQVPSPQLTGLPVARLERTTAPGDALQRYQDVLLHEARATLKDAIATTPEFFTGANAALADAEGLAELPAFGTWAADEKANAEREAAILSVDPISEVEPVESVVSHPVSSAERSRKPFVGWLIAVLVVSVAGMAFVANRASSPEDVSGSPTPTASATSSPSAARPTVTPTSKASTKPSAKPTPKPTASRAKSDWPPKGYTAVSSGAFAFKVLGVDAAPEGGSLVRVSVLGKRSCDTWRASIGGSGTNGRESSDATAFDFKNPNPTISTGKPTTINFLFSTDITSVRQDFQFNCAG